MSTTLWMIVGPSGTGKSTLKDTLLATMPNVREAVSHTTRAIRPGEQDGVTYHYIDKNQFERLEAQGYFLETVTYNGNRYGVSRREIDEKLALGDVIIIVEGHGAKQLKAAYPGRSQVMFLLPPDRDELYRRMINRVTRNGEIQPSPEVIAEAQARIADEHLNHEMSYLFLADVKISPGTPEEMAVAARHVMFIRRVTHAVP